MKQQVARIYEFQGRHSIPYLDPPWNEPHDHVYTVTVVAEREAPETVENVDELLVVDTDRLDAIWAELMPIYDPDQRVLLDELFSDTSVEGLSRRWYETFRLAVPQVVRVEVREDNIRWGSTGA